MIEKKKIIATLVPLSSLSSSKLSAKDQGTFAAGLPFLDWLERTHQNGWVMLPLNGTQLVSGSKKVHVPSPYKGYGIGLDPRYLSSSDKECDSNFLVENGYWLDDYALFCALRDKFGTDDWREWPDEVKKYSPIGIKKWTKKLRKEIDFYKNEQCLLHTAFAKLKSKAKKNNIYLIGDIAYYMSLKSPLVWSNQDLFELGSEGELNDVSGILWGHFDRQVWGHPLYKWGGRKQQKRVLKLWKLRLRYHSVLYDIVRIDHVKAFYKFGVLNINDRQKDGYKIGPGEKVVGELVDYSNKIGLKIFVEDSGHFKLDALIESQKKHSLASMRIYRFAYNEKTKLIIEGNADIGKYPKNTVVYTTTHDTETLVGYFSKLGKGVKKLLAEHAGTIYTSEDREFAKNIRDVVIASAARIVIVPIQDWLLIKDRINVPGTEKEIGDTNWSFKLKIPVEELPFIM